MSDTPINKVNRPLRSQAWFGLNDKNGFMYRSWMKNQGIPEHHFDGRPVIGICNTWSELTPCNGHFRELAERVRRGILEAGGVPVEFPVFSNGESNLRPSAMLTRNLAAMDVEEAIRGNPLDGVVLLCGCDKTTPALVMGAVTCNLPCLVVSGGPMLNGKHNGQDVGSGTLVWRLSEAYNAGDITLSDFLSAEGDMSRSTGTCNTMGTASTMACIVEALGLSLPHNAAIPAVDSRRNRLAHMSGMRIVEMVRENLTPDKIVTRQALLNAIRITSAIGGSTNAVIHLKAIAQRMELPLVLDDWQEHGRHIPTLVNLQPAGKYLMEDFYYAGGLPAVIKRLLTERLLDGNCLTVNGNTLAGNNSQAPCFNSDVIREIHNPLCTEGGIAVVRGNLAPRGAVIKVSAASPHLLQHRGRALVFESFEDYKNRIHDEALDVDKNTILVLRNCGPKGYPGMPEIANLGLPAKLLRAGVTDMLRLSDARMSGTAYGTVVLHVTPEARDFGPLAAVETNDWIELDVATGLLHLEVDQDIIDARLEQKRALTLVEKTGGYQQLYIEHVLQADEGCDFDFLIGKREANIPAHSH